MRESRFERLYAEHAQRLFGFLLYRTGDRDLAEDLLADTFESAFRARARFDPRRGSERAWLYAIALNRLRDDGRHRAAEARALERLAGGPAHEEDPRLVAVAEHDAVLPALGRLRPEEREVVALRFGADLALKEIAAALEVPRTTVEARLYRALRELREALDEL
ncbi:MAG TPA: sigma-70 family RNA polymerase sigma factor [Baekduia sp.]|nr:sigma-70 family RNA polymerase sigma factor [Baekduia sp.]